MRAARFREHCATPRFLAILPGMLTRPWILFWRGTLCVLIVGITYVALTPHPPIVLSENDKINHALAFYALALSLDFSFPGRGYDLIKALPLLAYALSIEAVQYAMPPRHFELLDVLADTLGLALYGSSIPILRRLPIPRRR